MLERQEKQRWFGMNRDHVVFGLLIAILLTALLLRVWRLGMYGYGNEYYAAAVKSMLQSWHNFFYAAAEPGASVMVDKPPLGLWLQAVSALIFGVNGFSLALPSALAGTLSVYILFLIVKTYFSHHAALASAFFLAVLPGVVWVDRTNLLDSLVICSMMVSIWFLLNAILRNQWPWLIASFAAIGLGFNIKMLQAYLILPAIVLVYLLSMRQIWWERLVHLTVATAVLLVISFSWIMIIDLTPEEHRPYVSSTENNRMLELVFGHNGLNRLISIRNQMNLSGGGGGNNPSGQVPGMEQSQPGQNPPSGAQQTSPPGQGAGRDDETGEPGLLRLFKQPLAQQVSWLLIFALISLVLTPFLLQWKWPLPPKNQLYLLMGVWLLTEVIFFSVADFFHAYYLIMLGVPIAALCGIGIWTIIQFWDQESWKGFAVSIAVLLSTVIFNTTVLTKFGTIGQTAKVVSGVIALMVVIGLVMCTLRKHCIWRNVALMGLIAFLGSASFLWSIQGIRAENAAVNQPVVGAGAYVSVSYQYNLSRNQRALLLFLEENTDPEQIVLMVNNSSAAAPYVLASGRAVFTTGGFTGNDPVVTSDEIMAMIDSGEIEFILAQQNQHDRELLGYYKENCRVRIFGSTQETQSNNPNQQPLAIFDCQN